LEFELARFDSINIKMTISVLSFFGERRERERRKRERERGKEVERKEGERRKREK
jgi:hypothetical protein